MKIAVECHSPLLQKSLEIFLQKYLSSLKKCDIVVRDKECLNDEKCFYIADNASADLLKPFSKSQLIIGLEERYKNLYTRAEAATSSVVSSVASNSIPMNFEILEKRIESLTQEYQENILRTVKAFYAK